MMEVLIIQKYINNIFQGNFCYYNNIKSKKDCNNTWIENRCIYPMNKKVCIQNNYIWDDDKKYCYKNVNKSECTEVEILGKKIKPFFQEAVCKNDLDETNCEKNHEINKEIKNLEKDRDNYLSLSNQHTYFCPDAKVRVREQCEEDKAEAIRINKENYDNTVNSINNLKKKLTLWMPSKCTSFATSEDDCTNSFKINDELSIWNDGKCQFENVTEEQCVKNNDKRYWYDEKCYSNIDEGECKSNSKIFQLKKCIYVNPEKCDSKINGKTMNSKCYKINNEISFDLDDENEKTKDFDKDKCKKMNYQKEYDCADCNLPNVKSYKRSETKFCQINQCENGYKLNEGNICKECIPKDSNGIYSKNSCKLEKCKAGFVLNSNKTKCITCSNNSNEFVTEWRYPGQTCEITKCGKGSILEKNNQYPKGICIECANEQANTWDETNNQCKDNEGNILDLNSKDKCLKQEQDSVLTYLCDEPKYFDIDYYGCISNLKKELTYQDLCKTPNKWKNNKCLDSQDNIVEFSKLKEKECEEIGGEFNVILKKCTHKKDNNATKCNRNNCSTKKQCRIENCKDGFKLKNNKCEGCPEISNNFSVKIEYTNVEGFSNTGSNEGKEEEEEEKKKKKEVKGQCSDKKSESKTECLEGNKSFGFIRDNCYNSNGEEVDLNTKDNPENKTPAQLCIETDGNYYGKNKCLTKDNTELTYEKLCTQDNKKWDYNKKECRDSNSNILEFSNLCTQDNKKWYDKKISYTKLGPRFNVESEFKYIEDANDWNRAIKNQCRRRVCKFGGTPTYNKEGELTSCTIFRKSTNCIGKWGEWSGWSACTLNDNSCGEGKRFRTRKYIIMHKKTGNGNKCPNSDGEEEKQEIYCSNPCPVDGFFDEWKYADGEPEDKCKEDDPCKIKMVRKYIPAENEGTDLENKNDTVKYIKNIDKCQCEINHSCKFEKNSNK